MVEAILQSALRSLALGLAAIFVLRFVLRAGPRLELTVWTFVLFAALAMPGVMQRLPIAIWPASSGTAASPALTAPAPTNVPAAPATSLDTPLFAESERADPAPTERDWRSIAGLVYVAVALFMALRLGAGLALAFVRRRSAERLDPARFEGRDVRVAPRLSAPTTFGGTILLPPDCAHWSETTWRAVLAHEASHLRRGDFFVQLLATAHRALFWFSPLAWFLTRRVAELAETLSDEDAALDVGDRTAYAEALLSVAVRVRHAPIGVAMARGPDVAARIERVLQPETKETEMSAKRQQIWLAAALMAPTFALVAGASAEDAPTPAPTTPAATQAVAPTPAPAEADIPDIERFAGVYKLGPPLTPGQAVTITRRRDGYYAKYTGYDEQPIEVRPDHDVALEGRRLHVKNVVSTEGVVTSFDFFWRGHFVSATRTDEGEAKRLEDQMAERKAAQNAPHRAVAIDGKSLEGLLGYYLINDDKVFHVTRDGDHLYSQTTGQHRVEIYPESERAFFYTTSPTQLTFQTDAQGVASGLILHQFGLERPCPKVSEKMANEIQAAFASRWAEQHKPHTVAAIDPKRLDGYVGTYELNPKFYLTATRDGDHLYMQSTGQNKFELFPYQKDDFFYTVVAAQVSFEMGDDGKASRIVLHQNGWDSPGGRIDPPAKP